MWRLLPVFAIWAAFGVQMPATNADEPLTLHTYVNLVQVPVLVLTERRLRADPVAPDRFTLSIDSGPRFAPKHVRQEGSDPLRVLLLLDLRPGTQRLVEETEGALQALAPDFGADDRLTISLLQARTLSHIGAAPLTPLTIGRFASFVDSALKKQTVALDGSQAPPLWDALAMALQRLGGAHERRVLVLVTDGRDRASKVSPSTLRRLADDEGTAIFAIREIAGTGTDVTRGNERDAALPVQSSDPLATLTEQTGGLTLEAQGQPLSVNLARILRMVRERYILEFARPSKLTGGEHALDVRIKGGRQFVRWSGVGVPLPDPKLSTEPNVLPPDLSVEPPIGNRPPVSHDEKPEGR